ncbi:lysis system i-spanin subunit Rz [Ferribacterium limneticum]|uniref:lysis system i-spanin subunit Rz n=1 Tax=Ferribacterium limneticum TaxID=76259 RepID=UPI001CF8416C|nr:lysis system i-spanin subunit Rz [Ferribacterium limneticum]UCV26790.1 lysis system i-spanin subunit Rz [Ferribacterium limneticum]UCV30707.1 lysis system i-spanin subunit Rz [Ferribacterium limneticum]
MNPYLILALIVAWGLSLVGVGNWQYDAGVTSERLVWQSQQSTQLRTALADVSRLQKQARDDEATHAKALADNSAHYQEQLLNEKATNARRVADIRNGTLKLRQPTGLNANAASGVKAPGTSPSGCDGQAGAEFSIETAEYLYNLAGEADEVVIQLGACQQVVIEDRKTVNTENESD